MTTSMGDIDLDLALDLRLRPELGSARHELQRAATAYVTVADQHELHPDTRGILAGEQRLRQAAWMFERARRAVDHQTYARQPLAASIAQAEDLVLRAGLAAWRTRAAYEALRADPDTKLPRLHDALQASQAAHADHELALAHYDAAIRAADLLMKAGNTRPT